MRRALSGLPPPGGTGARLWANSLELAYSKEIEEASRISGLPMPLLAAIIRFESNYRNTLVSRADAIGLLQVRIGTANEIAVNCLGEKPVRSRELRDPERNLLLGSLYIAEVNRRHQNNWPIMLAGYNAGPGMSRQWLERFSGLDTFEWVEQITYPNAAAYLKRIIGAVPAYWSLYYPALGDSCPEISMPAEIPQSLVPFLDEDGSTCHEYKDRL